MRFKKYKNDAYKKNGERGPIQHDQSPPFFFHPKSPQTAPKQDGVQQLVDIEQIMAEGKGRGYERWATMHNLKQMAATLNVYQAVSYTHLDVYKRQHIRGRKISFR